MTIKRPDVIFNEKNHSYTLDGEKLAGVSSIAKIGDDEVWGVASAWAFRIGYEGAHKLFLESEDWAAENWSADELREHLKKAGLTPWSKNKKAKDRGTAIHDALEHLAQKNEVPILEQYPESEQGYVQGLCRWYLDYRPEFVATEVQVVSETYKYAGRYDLRCRLYNPPGDTLIIDVPALCLVDLKTGKRCYPTSQFPQLAGYEHASVEMGYPRTDGQYILNVHEDGTYDFVQSTATKEHFLAYLAAYKAIKEIKESCKKQQ